MTQSASSGDAELALATATDAFGRGELRVAAELALRTAELGARAGRADLMADAALVLLAVPDATTAATVDRLCREALAVLERDDAPRRARLLAQLSIALHHREDLAQATRELARADELIASLDDPIAVGLAAHARALSIAGDDPGPGLLPLAQQMAEAAAAIPNDLATVHLEMLARAWRVESMIREGRPIEAGLEIDALDVLAARSGRPLVRWNALVARAGLEQAVGRLVESQGHARVARTILPEGQRAQAEEVFVGQLLLAAMDLGLVPPEIEAARGRAIGGPLIAIAMTALFELEMGNREQAQAAYESLRERIDDVPADRRAFPTIFAAAELAASFEDAATAEAVRRLLEPYRERTLVSAIGCVGPVGYALAGIAELQGRLDDAVRHAETAVRWTARAGFGPWLARSRLRLARVLETRAGPGDRARAAREARLARATASQLGMGPTAAAAAVQLARSRSEDRLSDREQEVATLVAAGSSNRAIAQALGLSERTIESHVQHILNKLGFRSRSQIAAWTASRVADGEESR
jgi:DNA-binding CsgD family transcriptional regulator